MIEGYASDYKELVREVEWTVLNRNFPFLLAPSLETSVTAYAVLN